MRPARSSNNKKRSSLTKEECLADASGNLGSDISISALIFSPSFLIVCRFSASLDGALGAKYFILCSWQCCLFYAVGLRSCESR